MSISCSIEMVIWDLLVVPGGGPPVWTDPLGPLLVELPAEGLGERSLARALVVRSQGVVAIFVVVLIA